MVAAAEVQPFHTLHILAEALLERRDRADEVVRVLLAQGVEVEALDAAQQLRLEVFLCDAEARGWAAGVVHGVLGRLGRALGIEAQAAAFARRTRQTAVGLPLVEGIEHNVVGIAQDFLEFALRIGRGVDVRLAAEFLAAEARFVQAGGRRAHEVLAQQRIDRKHGKRLLRKQDFRARAVGHVAQHRKVLHQPVFVHDKTGGGKLGKSHISPPAPDCR